MSKFLSKKYRFNPPAILAIGFGSLIFLGTILLNLPIATQTGERIGYINALFTSASAVCVTGLVVVNTAEYWSLFGQIVILLLIQIGGLGFMTMATAFALVMGKKIRLKERLVIKEQLNQETMSGLVKLMIGVILLTFLIEIIGAIILATRFIPIYGTSRGIWYAIFHSISAFCNAGFDITGDSMVPFVGDGIVNLAITMLVILGGLGFSVIIDLLKHRNLKRISVHTKLVLSISLVLIIIGTIMFYVLEYTNPYTIASFEESGKIKAAFFQSVITRTAGFNSVDTGMLREATAFLFVIFMFIGGSPGSTAGGIKTTTFGSIILITLATIKGEKDVNVFGRRISEESLNKAVSIVFISLALIMIVSFILTITENARFIDIIFEATSAFATVGLSRGLTPELTDIGKIIITITMYIGRVGPMTMAYAFGKRISKSKYRYAECNIMVG